MSAQKRAKTSATLKARWAALSVEEKTRRYRQQAANMMVSHPEIAIWPDRWLHDAFNSQEPQ